LWRGSVKNVTGNIDLNVSSRNVHKVELLYKTLWAVHNGKA